MTMALGPRRARTIPALCAVAAVVFMGQTVRGQTPPAPGAVDLASSRVYVFVAKARLGHDHAVMGSLRAGQVQLGAAEQAGQIVFDMQSFRADTPEARKTLGLDGETDESTRRQVDDNMLGPAVLDAANHPTATFDIRSALPAAQPAAPGKTAYDLVGSFTLHGVTQPLTVRAEAETIGPIVRLWGGFAIRQTDFRIKPFSKLGGIVGVADELKIYGDIRVATGARP